MMRISGDQAAVRILLGQGTERQKQAKLTKLARDLRNLVECRFPCPECGDDGPHDLNVSDDREAQCAGCHLNFEVPEVYAP